MPAPVTVTKTEPTATPLTTPKTDYVYKPPTEEELDRIFGVSDTVTDKPVTAKPT